jgi:cytochrome c peroxidase
LAILPLLFSCSNQDDDLNLPLDFSVPSNFPDLTYDISTNPPTEGFELGKNYSMMVA